MAPLFDSAKSMVKNLQSCGINTHPDPFFERLSDRNGIWHQEYQKVCQYVLDRQGEISTTS